MSLQSSKIILFCQNSAFTTECRKTAAGFVMDVLQSELTDPVRFPCCWGGHPLTEKNNSKTSLPIFVKYLHFLA